MDYSKEEIALSLYYKELKATDCGIPAIGRAEKNVSRNSVLSNSKNDLCITNDSLRSENWLPDLDSSQTIPIVLPNTIHACKKKNL